MNGKSFEAVGCALKSFNNELPRGIPTRLTDCCETMLNPQPPNLLQNNSYSLIALISTHRNYAAYDIISIWLELIILQQIEEFMIFILKISYVFIIASINCFFKASYYVALSCLFIWLFDLSFLSINFLILNHFIISTTYEQRLSGFIILIQKCITGQVFGCWYQWFY